MFRVPACGGHIWTHARPKRCLVLPYCYYVTQDQIFTFPQMHAEKPEIMACLHALGYGSLKQLIRAEHAQVGVACRITRLDSERKRRNNLRRHAVDGVENTRLFYAEVERRCQGLNDRLFFLVAQRGRLPLLLPFLPSRLPPLPPSPPAPYLPVDAPAPPMRAAVAMPLEPSAGLQHDLPGLDLWAPEEWGG